MRTLFESVGAVAAVLFACGAVASAQDFTDGQGNPLDEPELVLDAGPDGEQPVAVLEGPASRMGDMLRALFGERAASLGKDAQDAINAGDPEAIFYITGDLPEADAHQDVEFLPDGSAFVLANRDSKNLVVFDADTNAFIREIPVSGKMSSFAITPDGQRAVVSLFDDQISVVDLTTGDETVLAGGGVPAQVRITSDGAFALVGNAGDQTLSVVDLGTDSVVSTWPLGTYRSRLAANFEPPAIAVGYTSGFELISNDTLIHPDVFNDQILVINFVTGDTTTLASAEDPTSIVVSADGTQAIISHTSFSGPEQVLTVVDTTVPSITREIPVGQRLNGPIAAKSDLSKVAVAVSNAMVIVDTSDDSVSANISTASVNQVYTTSDDERAICVGFRGSLLSYETESLIRNTNNAVSADFGAVRPGAEEAVMFSQTFGEDLVKVATDNSAGLLFFGSAGPGIEGDRARTVALSDDGATAIVVHNLSDQAAIVDVASGTVKAYVPIGQRPGRTEISPDGQTAVVASRDSSLATIIDLTDHSSVDVPITRRGDAIVFSPDSQFAYIAVVASGDGVERINLDTLETTKLLTVANLTGTGYSYSQFSDMAISPDGSTLVVCGSFNDVIDVIDTGTFTISQTIDVLENPSEVEFSDDGSRFYVSAKDTDQLFTFRQNLGVWGVETITNVGDQPFRIEPSPGAGDLVYVINWNDETVSRVDVGAGIVTGVWTAPERPADFVANADATKLFVATGNASFSLGAAGFVETQDGQLSTVDTATMTEDVIIDLDGKAPSDIATDAIGDTFVMAAPLGDGIVVIGADVVDCTADWDGNGVINAADVGAFLSDYFLDLANGTLVTDFDGNGIVNAADVGSFLSAYFAELNNPDCNGG